ncbi:biotin/lipoyl-containing protein [Bovifimicola ammoniilytica]|uniref:biotin/lipoyl-containing protein n=1 Tax=Bovifimicola ammoniilytica TaxID=2981720 RepID=UPI000821594D|nr:biotin/lipoyl-containing protein [Bovifimicola ammoniilytica]MCU6752584.1 biotin/lipoyl-binding protein [Bovifimicola ammoniilytica]SCJ29890.1 Glutaconyl-CoA decarboxylase subunit gamma [uncultured Eubacterium sp.]
MKNYRITVNGNVYDVEVEELGTGAATQTAAPKAAPKAVAAPKAAAPAAAGSEGAVKVNSPMPGKILSVKASVGQAVKRGEVIMILEAMKMENEIVAPSDGTIASINVNEGASVEAGSVLASLN